jgi:hypothetical protein
MNRRNGRERGSAIVGFNDGADVSAVVMPGDTKGGNGRDDTKGIIPVRLSYHNVAKLRHFLGVLSSVRRVFHTVSGQSGFAAS